MFSLKSYYACVRCPLDLDKWAQSRQKKLLCTQIQMVAFVYGLPLMLVLMIWSCNQFVGNKVRNIRSFDVYVTYLNVIISHAMDCKISDDSPLEFIISTQRLNNQYNID